MSEAKRPTFGSAWPRLMVEREDQRDVSVDQVREALWAQAAKWHDEETLSDSSCEHRQLEILAYIAGHEAATASHAAEVEALRSALREIAKPGYGLELNDPIEQREHYWQQALLRCRETARAALKGD